MLQTAHPDPITMLFQDLRWAGVSDVAVDDPSSFISPFKADIQPAAVEQETASTSLPKSKPAAIEEKKAPPQPAAPSVDVADLVWHSGEKGGLQILLPSLRGVGLSEPEKNLLNAMLKAIDEQASGFIHVARTASASPALAERIVDTVKTAQAGKLLIFSQDMWVLCLNRADATIAAWREGGQDWQPGCPYALTYGLKALLSQPLLKRLAWQDLQKLSGGVDA